MTIQQNSAYVPPALRATKPKHAAPRGIAAKRFARGAILSVALAGGGAFVAGPLAGLGAGTAEAAPCAPGDLICGVVGGGSDLINNSAAGPQAALGNFGVPDLIGPGGLLIGNGTDALPDCKGDACNGGNGGLLFGNGGAGANGGTGGNAGLFGSGGRGGDGLVGRPAVPAATRASSATAARAATRAPPKTQRLTRRQQSP